MGRYRIYSHEWHGISLVDVARECHVSEHSVAARDLYDALYRKWNAADFQPDEGWLRAKGLLAAALKAAVEKYRSSIINVISLGAGLGVVERHLVEAGWPVELQECQATSLAYASRFIDTKMWAADFDQIPGDSYDVVLALSLVYVFDDRAYAEFAEQCFRMLRPGGILVIWDHDPKLPLSLLKRYFKRYVLGRHDLAWGWLRSPSLHEAIVESKRFTLLERQFYDADIRRVPEPWRVAGFQLPNGRSVALNLLFRKN